MGKNKNLSLRANHFGFLRKSIQLLHESLEHNELLGKVLFENYGNTHSLFEIKRIFHRKRGQQMQIVRLKFAIRSTLYSTVGWSNLLWRSENLNSNWTRKWNLFEFISFRCLNYSWKYETWSTEKWLRSESWLRCKNKFFRKQLV